MKNTALKIAGALTGILLLSACGQDNPLMKNPEFESLTDTIRGNRFMSPSQTVEVWVCPRYFAYPAKESTHKTACEKWLPEFFKKETGDFEVEAALTGKTYTKPTLEDFRDPALWQAVIKKIEKPRENSGEK